MHPMVFIKPLPPRPTSSRGLSLLKGGHDGKSNHEFCICGNHKRRGYEYCRKCKPEQKPKKKTPKQSAQGRTAKLAQKTLRKALWKPYSKRNDTCKKIGFKSYAAYLDSPLWKSIRKRVFSFKGGDCVSCGGKANQIHHSEYTYENLSGKTFDGLYPVCGDCHHSAEFSNDGDKRSIDEANNLLKITGTYSGQT